MGRLHLYNCMHIKDAQVVAVADQSKKFLKKAESIGVKRLSSDYHDMFKENDLDAVIISLPNFLHLESVQLALESGCNVFVEKPLARTVEECQQIADCAKKSGRKLMIGHCMRFLDPIEKIKAKVENGIIGSLEVITAEEILNGPFSHAAVPTPIPEWWFDPKRTGGGVLLDIGYHMIDLYRFFAGEANLVFSQFDHKMNLPMEDGAILVLNSRDSDVKGIINVGWYQKSIFPSFNFRFIAHGNAGYASTDDLAPSNFYLYAMKQGLRNFARRVIGKRIRPLAYTYYYEQYVKEMMLFFDCIKRDVEPPVTALDGLRTLEIIEQAYQQKSVH